MRRKTRALIRESTKFTEFSRAPTGDRDRRTISGKSAIQSRCRSADKAEKIIRDIETIIRREEARNPAYVELDERLQDLIQRKRELNEDIEEILSDLQTLYNEVDEVGNLPTGWALQIADDSTCFLKSNMRQAMTSMRGRLVNLLTCWSPG